MTRSTTHKNLVFIIGALLLSNIAVLVYFLCIRKPAEPRPRIDKRNGLTEMLQKEVGFNEEQVANYKQLREKQWDTIQPLFDEMRKAKSGLFPLLSNPTAGDSMINAAAARIAENQKALDLLTFGHFKNLRSLCTPGQLAKYDSMVIRMFQRMGKPVHRNEVHNDEKSK